MAMPCCPGARELPRPARSCLARVLGRSSALRPGGRRPQTPAGVAIARRRPCAESHRHACGVLRGTNTHAPSDASVADSPTTNVFPVGPLFCVTNGATRGRAWSAAAARTELRGTAATAGIRRRFAPHQLRHSHAVKMAHEGVQLDPHPAPTGSQQFRDHLDLPPRHRQRRSLKPCTAAERRSSRSASRWGHEPHRREWRSSRIGIAREPCPRTAPARPERKPRTSRRGHSVLPPSSSARPQSNRPFRCRSREAGAPSTCLRLLGANGCCSARQGACDPYG
jgi:hypothetical protein